MGLHEEVSFFLHTSPLQSYAFIKKKYRADSDQMFWLAQQRRG